MARTITSRIELISVRTLIEGLDQGHINLVRDIDEIGENISQDERCDFIVSMMGGIPVLPFVFDGTIKPWKILDGSKRLTLLWGFFNNRFPITDSPYMIVGGVKFFRDLPMFKQRKFMAVKILCYVINPPTGIAAVNDIKSKMNKSL